MKRKKILPILLLSIVIITQFCRRTDAVSERVWVIGIPSDPSSADPLFAADLTGRKLASLVYRRLVMKNEEGVFQPDLADFRNEPDGSSVFTLKKGFLKSDDVIFCLGRGKTEKSPFRSMFLSLKNIEKIDEVSFRIVSEIGQNETLSLLSSSYSSIYSESEYKKNKSFVSEGLYRITEWNRNSDLTLLRTESAPKEYPETVRLKNASNSFTSIYLFEKHQLDLIKIPYYFTDRLSGKGSAVQVKGRSVQYAAVNWRNPCFDRNFRLALNHSIDRKKIMDRLFLGLAEDTVYSFPKKFASGLPEMKFEYSPELAGNYLKKSACYPEILQKPLSFRMRADDENKAKGPVILQYLKDLGLKVELEMMEKAALYRENAEGKGDITLLTWYSDNDESIDFIDPVFSSKSLGGGGNRSFFENEEMQKIIEVSAKSGTLSLQNRIRAAEIQEEKLPWIYLWSLHENYLISDKLRNSPSAGGFIF
ncbi:MAG TPA: ABC transporter substrate-binding protein [Leptospiraceae bacterium]|nr:ABC transporter substrate-binding protein [Leptospiraceae bacterium]HMY67060.1 ABC transporter substrate-binding protein [Leptospiraceae bacterium]HMZ57979.1 ABC transporter substrate-binding protein [Leptospiraceae bacterium]HNF14759.1 ABC transporter substrate-binding protein [Leptospiraceae bacterium]HNF25588.1 ABC transporter substrate-binding protein [Leptospiraceae bacterium]